MKRNLLFKTLVANIGKRAQKMVKNHKVATNISYRTWNMLRAFCTSQLLGDTGQGTRKGVSSNIQLVKRRKAFLLRIWI